MNKLRHDAIRLRKEFKKVKKELDRYINSSYLDKYDNDYIPYLKCTIKDIQRELTEMGVR